MGKLAKIIDAHSFESLCKDILSIIYHENFSIYGRNGQKQHGIDLYSSSKVAQCKCYTDNTKESYSRLFNQIKQDYTIACNELNFFSEFIILTALDRDTNVQDMLRNLSNSKHPISIYFWEDIEQIALNNYEILKLHFPYLTNADDMNNFSVNQSAFKVKIRSLFEKYHVYKLVNDPTITAPFDENCIYNFDIFVNEMDNYLQMWSRSSNSISSALVEKCFVFIDTLSNYYHFISCHTITNVPYNGWTRPLNNSQEDLDTFVDLKKNIITLYNEMIHIL